MKKLILLLTVTTAFSISIAQPSLAFVKSLPCAGVNGLAININGTILETDWIMKVSYNNAAGQITLLYGLPTKNEVLTIPGSQKDVVAINMIRQNLKLTMQEINKENQEKLYQLQQTYGDTYVNIQKKIDELRKKPLPETSEERIELSRQIDRLEDAKKAWMQHIQGEDSFCGKTYIQIMQEAGLSTEGLTLNETAQQQTTNNAVTSGVNGALDAADTVIKMINLFK